MLKLNFQYFDYLMLRDDSLENTLTLGKTVQEEKGKTDDEVSEWHH